MSWKKQLEQANRPGHVELARQLQRELSHSAVETDVSSARMATFKAGGTFDILARIRSQDDLVALMLFVQEYKIELHILGGMSNTLVRDGGCKGIAMILEGDVFTRFELEEGAQEDRLYAGAAVPTSRIVKMGRERGWADAAPLSGIPGYVGGATAMNAGSRQVWLSQFVIQVDYVSAAGEKKSKAAGRMGFAYRSTKLKGGVVTGVQFGFERDVSERTEELYRQQLQYRSDTQPTGTRNCGSVFRNPEGDSAGRLIELVGLKGVRIHGARISPVHANFIENIGGATASDIEALIQLAQKKVKDEAGVELQRELRIIGTTGTS